MYFYDDLLSSRSVPIPARWRVRELVKKWLVELESLIGVSLARLSSKSVKAAKSNHPQSIILANGQIWLPNMRGSEQPNLRFVQKVRHETIPDRTRKCGARYGRDYHTTPCALAQRSPHDMDHPNDHPCLAQARRTTDIIEKCRAGIYDTALYSLLDWYACQISWLADEISGGCQA